MFNSNASNSSLRFRSFLYIGFSLIVVLVSFINIHSFADFKLYEYLQNKLNWVVFFTPILLVLLIDLICIIVRCHKKNKTAKKDLEENADTSLNEELIVEEKVKEESDTNLEFEKINKKQQEEINKEVEESLEKESPMDNSKKLSPRKEKIVAMARAKSEKKLAKKEAKINKKVQKIKEKIESRQEK